MAKFLAAEIRFEFDGEVGVCRVYADGSKDIAWAGASFQYEAAAPAIRAAITLASTLAVFA